MAALPVVLLMRSPGDPDVYSETFQAASFKPINIPVLEHAFVKTEKIKDIISLGPIGTYRGVIITSTRGAEAWISAADAVVDQTSASWQDTPFYVVGSKTADGLKATAGSPARLLPSSDQILGAAEAGSGEKLARFIIHDIQSRSLQPSEPGLPFLYLTGDKNKDTIQTLLGDQNITTDALQVYETRARANLAEEIRIVLESVDETADLWIAFFAPSSAEISLETFETILDLPTSNDPFRSRGQRQARFAAIGKTTAAYLSEEHPAHFRVSAVASSPTPLGLLKAIQDTDEKNGQ